MSALVPGNDQVMLTAPDRSRLCNSGGCSGWESSRQVAVKYRPGLVVIDTIGTAGAAQSSGGRA